MLRTVDGSAYRSRINRIAEFSPLRADEIGKATPLPQNGYREGFLSTKQDVDYYVLQTSEPVLAKRPPRTR